MNRNQSLPKHLPASYPPAARPASTSTTAAAASEPDLSGYDRNVRAAKILKAAEAPIQRPTASERQANDRFFDPTAEPITRDEQVLGRKIVSVVAAVLVIVAVAIWWIAS
jgi:hypothetical protein